jgi:hypothetical protein
LRNLSKALLRNCGTTPPRARSMIYPSAFGATWPR